MDKKRRVECKCVDQGDRAVEHPQGKCVPDDSPNVCLDPRLPFPGCYHFNPSDVPIIKDPALLLHSTSRSQLCISAQLDQGHHKHSRQLQQQRTRTPSQYAFRATCSTCAAVRGNCGSRCSSDCLRNCLYDYHDRPCPTPSRSSSIPTYCDLNIDGSHNLHAPCYYLEPFDEDSP